MICDAIDTLKNVMGSPPSATDQDTFTEVSDNFSITGCDGGISMAKIKLNTTFNFFTAFWIFFLARWHSFAKFSSKIGKLFCNRKLTSVHIDIFRVVYIFLFVFTFKSTELFPSSTVSVLVSVSPSVPSTSTSFPDKHYIYRVATFQPR